MTEKEQLEKLRAFAQELFRGYPEDFGDFDRGAVQEFAIEHGLLSETKPKAPCGENCSCANYFSGQEFEAGEATCYQRTQLLDGSEEPKANDIRWFLDQLHGLAVRANAAGFNMETIYGAGASWLRIMEVRFDMLVIKQFDKSRGRVKDAGTLPDSGKKAEG